MAYMQKALTLVQSGETIQFIKPWWEVVEQFTIDAMMLLAVTSVTADLFQGKGALQCVALNKTLHFEAQQQFFVNQECQEVWPIYAKYFPYFLFFQCILFVIVNNVWFGICKDLVLDFSKLVERCNKTPIRRKNVRKLMHYLDERKSGRVLRKEISAGEGMKSAYNESIIEALSLKERLAVEEAELAMSLCEEVSLVTEALEKTVFSSFTFYGKSFASLLLVIAVFAMGLEHLVSGDFDFYFDCHLNASDHDRILDEDDYACVNKTTTLSKWLQILFLFEVAVFAIADVYGILGWLRVMMATSGGCGRGKGDEYAATNAEEKERMSPGGHVEDVVDTPLVDIRGPSEVVSMNIQRKRGSDTGFMLYLLRETDKDIAENFCNFMDPQFHEELEEIVTNQRWPLASLKDRLRGGETESEKTLSLADQDLLGLPISLSLVEVSGDHLVELDLSFNRNLDDLHPLVDLKNLNTLKCSRCGVVDMTPVTELTALNFLDLSSNKIGAVPAEISRLTELKAFWIDANPLTALCEEAPSLPKLNEIRVEEALMASLPQKMRKRWKASKLQPRMWKKVKSGEGGASLGESDDGGGSQRGGDDGGNGGTTATVNLDNVEPGSDQCV